MFRFTSLFGLALVTLAAVALVSAYPQPAVTSSPEPADDHDALARNTPGPRLPVSLYFAEFSAN
jgi:hypothetical protein